MNLKNGENCIRKVCRKINLKYIQELYPAIHFIFLVTASASLQPQPKRMSFLSGLGFPLSFQDKSKIKKNSPLTEGWRKFKGFLAGWFVAISNDLSYYFLYKLPRLFAFAKSHPFKEGEFKTIIS